MSRRVPDCAHCGKTLKKGQVMRVRYLGLPGEPEVGWHFADCFGADPLASLIDNTRSETNRRSIEDTLKQIAYRGASRLSAGAAWRDDVLMRTVKLWGVIQGVGHIAARVEGGWITSICPRWFTGSATSERPKRICKECRRLLPRVRPVAAEEVIDG